MSRPVFTRPDVMKVEMPDGSYLSGEPTEHGFVVGAFNVKNNDSIGLTIGSDGIDALRAWCEAVLDATKAKGATS